jgi:hypothetical protein
VTRNAVRLLAGLQQLQHIPLPGLLAAAGHPSAAKDRRAGGARGVLDAGPVHIKFAQARARPEHPRPPAPAGRCLGSAAHPWNGARLSLHQPLPHHRLADTRGLASPCLSPPPPKVCDPHVVVLLSDGSALLLRGDPAGRRLGLARSALPPLHDSVHAAPDEQARAQGARAAGVAQALGAFAKQACLLNRTARSCLPAAALL